MAPRPRGNTALLEQENVALTQEEQTLLDDNRKAEREPEPAPEPTPEPAPAAEPKPEPAAAPAAPAAPAAAAPEGGTAPATEAQKQRMVEYGAFHEERERRKEERAKREKAEQELARLTGRFQSLEDLARAAAQEMQPKAQSPDVNTDPVGHFQAEIAQRDAKLAQFEQWQQQQQRAAQEQQVINQIRQRAVAAEAEFAKQTPDYTEAADYVQMVRNAQLEAIGFTDPVARQQQLAFEALNLAAGAEQRGQNAAQIIYNMAKASGWKPKGAAAPAPATNGASQSVQDQAGAKKLETVARGQAANTSIGKLNGQSAPSGELDLEALLKMSEEDFSKVKPTVWKKLMGG